MSGLERTETLAELEREHFHWPPFVKRGGKYYCCCGVEVVGGSRSMGSQSAPAGQERDRQTQDGAKPSPASATGFEE